MSEHELEHNKAIHDAAILNQYVTLDSPNLHIIQKTLLLSTLAVLTYLFLNVVIPNGGAIDMYASLFFSDTESYRQWVENKLFVPNEQHADRIVLILYLAFYGGMWWTYFLSKASKDEKVEEKRLKVQTLRRLLGTTSKHWDSASVHENDDRIVENYRRKGEVGMIVIAILLAASILIFEQLSSIWLSELNRSLWNMGILWTGMLSLVISFACLMLCVDSLDTMFNRFASDSIRNYMINYFYDYTINPRYAATAAIFFAMVLLLAYHSEVLASLTVGVIFCVGYKFWFPSFEKEATDIGLELRQNNRSLKKRYVLLIVGMPIFVSVLNSFYHA